MRGQGVTVEAQLSEAAPRIQADENQLRQAFLNLLRNAGEAMAGAGGTLLVATAATDGALEIAVSDTGPGIEEDHLKQVFEPFFSTKERGTGLGLALTQQIIHEHGGTIAVRSAPGDGTVFTISLPLVSAG